MLVSDHPGERRVLSRLQYMTTAEPGTSLGGLSPTRPPDVTEPSAQGLGLPRAGDSGHSGGAGSGGTQLSDDLLQGTRPRPAALSSAAHTETLQTQIPSLTNKLCSVM